MRQAGMRSLSPQHTHRPARVCGKGEAWNGRYVFRLNGQWYDAAVNHLWLEARGLHLDSTATLQTLMGQQLWLHSPIRSVAIDKCPVLAQHAEPGRGIPPTAKPVGILP
jgi:hypothetical protein